MIQHAEELLKFYDDDTAARAALEEIPDENLKTFLKLELNLKWTREVSARALIVSKRNHYHQLC